jgi:cytochrome c oxidase subunit 2
VIHSLFLPDFKIKEDAVPGMETSMWVMSNKTGEHEILCAEYCGKGHSFMSSTVKFMPEEDFKEWYMSGADKKAKEILPAPATNLLDESGCLECHSTDGSMLVGPSFKGLFGRRETVITDGIEREVYVDEKYLRKSVLYPDTDIVKDYPDIMPSYEGELSDEEIQLIIQYVKTLH